LVILYIIDSLEVGGAEVLLVNLMNELVAQNKAIVHCAVLNTQVGALQKKLHPSIQLHKIAHTKFNFLKVILQLRAIVNQNSISLVHAHLYNGILLSRFLQRHIKKVFTYHNLNFEKDAVYYSWWRTALDKFTFKNQYKSIYVSQQVKQSVERIRDKKYNGIVLNNFADKIFTKRYELKNRNIFEVFCIGNLKKVKNYELILQSAALFTDKNIVVHVYGQGELHQDLQARIDKSNLPIILHGATTITPELLQQHDLFLMSSINEGMPISLIEVVSSGIPCLLPNHLPSLMQIAGDSAMYYSIKNAQELCDSIQTIAASKPLLQKLATNSLQCGQEFTIQNHINQLLKYYIA
jgi:glycosyltransferase involved in cell wall biosynthesis